MEQNLLFHTIEFLAILVCVHQQTHAKNTKLVFLRYNTTTKGYRLWEPKTKKVKGSVDVIFDETSTYNNFVPKLAHSIELLQVGTKPAPTFTRKTQPHIVGEVGAMQPPTMKA